MSMFKLYKLSLCGKIKLLNKNNILVSIDVIKFQVRKKGFFVYNYSEDIERLINKQIQAEQQAAQDYLGMAVSFLHPQLSRPGAGGFFMKMYEEELGHMQDFVQYQILRGGIPKISSLKEAKVNLCLTLYDAFCRALDMEKFVTHLLMDIVKEAECAKDYQCADFVTSVFLSEQMKSINEMSNHVTKLSRLCDEHSFYHYDLELARTHPFAYKVKV